MIKNSSKNLFIRNKKNRKKRRYAEKLNRYRKTVSQYKEKKVTTEDGTKTNMVAFAAPKNFSIIENTEETLQYFSEIIEFIRFSAKINSHKRAFIDVNQVENLSIDAIVFLLAVVHNIIANRRSTCKFSGNLPADENAYQIMLESGFDEYVKFPNRFLLNLPATKGYNSVTILSGRSNNPDKAKQIIDFVIMKTGYSNGDLRFLYVMLIELMANVKEHAYDNSLFLPKWYCYVKHVDDCIEFIFLDTGLGIPSTINKNFLEKVNLLGLKKDSEFVLSALDGKFPRTKTKLVNRGRGLPSILENQVNGRIKNLTIISNKAKVIMDSTGQFAEDMLSMLEGTLFYWTISIKNN